VSRRDGTRLVAGSVRLIVFGPEAGIGFYEMTDAQGQLHQRMVVMENVPDVDAGEVGPAIPGGSLIVLKRYAPKQIIAAEARIGGKERMLDLKAAKVFDDHEFVGALSATVLVPRADNGKSVEYVVQDPTGGRATIAQRFAPSAGGVTLPIGRSARTYTHSRPVLVRPRPGSSTGTGVSSANR